MSAADDELSSQRLRALMKATSDAVYSMSPDWRELRQLEGQGFLADARQPTVAWMDAYIPAEEQELVRSTVRRAIETNAPFELEHRIIRADGTIGRTFSRAVPVRDGNGCVVEWFGTAREVTGERFSTSIERDSADSDARFRDLADHAPVMMWVTDPQGSCTYLNRAWYDFTGQTREHALGFGWLDATHPDSQEEIGREFLIANEQRAPFRGEYRLRRSDGTYRWVIDSASPRFGHNGEYLGYVGSVMDIHDRHEAEQRLRRSEQRFRLAADSVQHIVWIVDREGRNEFFNRQWFVYTGAPLEPITIQEVADRYIHPDDMQVTLAAFEAAARTRTTFVVEHRIRSHSGDYRTFMVRGEPYLDPESGEIVRWYGTSVDIHDRQLAQLQLRESEERLRLATENAEVGFWDVDIVNGMLHWSSRVRAMFGVSANVPVSIEDFYAGLHPEDREATQAAYLAAADPEKRPLYDVEYRTIGKEDGIVRWVAAKGRGIFDAAGNCVRVIGTAIDISQRKAIEQQLRELNETLERHVQQRTAERNRVWSMSRDLFAIMGLDGYLKAVNPAWQATLGHDEATLLALPFAQLVHPDDHAAVRKVIDRLRRGETVYRFEDRLRHQDGSWRWIAWSLVPEGPVFYAVGRDVTAENHAAAELERAQEALRQSQKMEAMGQLTGGVAHDFNNLLTPIVGSLDILQRKRLGGEREQRLLASAMQSAERAKTLVQRLLAFARRQPLQPTAVDVAKLVSEMAGLVSSTTGPQIKTVVETEADLPPAIADANQIEMALLNLAVNARDAMPDGGTLRISASAATVGPGNGPKLKPGSYIRLSVADTGHGMDETTLSRAIEPFFSTKGVGKGTGLGLSMVHGLASQLGGALTIRSRVGLGTNVELWLPQSSEAPGLDAPLPGRDTPAHARGTVLLVDDEELVRQSTAEMLSELGYVVVHAESAEHALALMEQGGQFDLLITDHLMPGMNGTELVRAIRARRPGLPVLLISGYADTDGIAADLPRLTKPFRTDELAASLGQLSI